MNSSNTLWAPESDSDPTITPAAAVAIAMEIIAACTCDHALEAFDRGRA